MLSDWTHWLSSVRPDEAFLLILPLLLFDAPRYSLGSAAAWLWDFLIELRRSWLGTGGPASYQHCPTVCVVIAGLNEASGLAQTLDTLWGTYPLMELIVVDDGSDDGMTDVARAFAAGKEGVTILRKALRGGKSAALNLALPFTNAELIVCVDGDSRLTERAIWEIVQPFSDPQVAAVSGTVLARNPFTNLVTWLQALEYLRSIFLGRMLAARLDILGIVSGAFGAFRRDVLERLGGWDVGPGEDGDLSLRIRKAGFRVTFAPYAQCLTNLPASWGALVKQRRRWEWAVVTLECRKHIDLADIRSPNFRFSNLLLLFDRWVFGIFVHIAFVLYVIWLCGNPPEHLFSILFLQYGCFVLLELVQLGLIFYYSLERKRDMLVCALFPLMPVYYLFMRFVSLYAIFEEMLTRRSFRDNFVPEHVRRVTWHW